MTIWHNDPPTDRTHISYSIFRTPTKGAAKLIILSAETIGVMMHYWNGRSRPCNMEDCEPCKKGHKPRWKGYMYICFPNSRRIVIFEYTDRVHQEFRDQLVKRKTLRGVEFNSARMGKRPNSPLQITFTDVVHDPDALPTVDGLEEVLERMWEVKQQPLAFDPQTDQQPPNYDESHHPEWRGHAIIRNGGPPK